KLEICVKLEVLLVDSEREDGRRCLENESIKRDFIIGCLVSERTTILVVVERIVKSGEPCSYRSRLGGRLCMKAEIVSTDYGDDIGLRSEGGAFVFVRGIVRIVDLVRGFFGFALIDDVEHDRVICVSGRIVQIDHGDVSFSIDRQRYLPHGLVLLPGEDGD
ncbi:hypothetical protein PENTCL1PPCAC_13526, partial [Pristionchus entomophagus]